MLFLLLLLYIGLQALLFLNSGTCASGLLGALGPELASLNPAGFTGSEALEVGLIHALVLWLADHLS